MLFCCEFCFISFPSYLCRTSGRFLIRGRSKEKAFESLVFVFVFWFVWFFFNKYRVFKETVNRGYLGTEFKMWCPWTHLNSLWASFVDCLNFTGSLERNFVINLIP